MTSYQANHLPIDFETDCDLLSALRLWAKGAAGPFNHAFHSCGALDEYRVDG